MKTISSAVSGNINWYHFSQENSGKMYFKITKLGIFDSAISPNLGIYSKEIVSDLHEDLATKLLLQ